MLLAVWLLTLALCIFVIFLIYRRREEKEDGLFLKLLGYSFIGAFSFAVNGLKLPLGFLVGLWIVSRPGKRNKKSKQSALFFGLVLFVWSLAAPAAGEAWYERTLGVEVETDNMFTQSFSDLWLAVETKLGVDPGARLEQFEASYHKDGQIAGLRMEFVERQAEGYVYYEAELNGKGNRLNVNRHRIDGTWLQYDRAIEMRRFAERIDSFDIAQLKPAKTYSFYRLETQEVGYVTYGIKDAETYVIEEDEVALLPADRLPVTGFWLSVCAAAAPPEHRTGPFSCDRADFIFDAVYETETAEQSAL